MANDSMQAAALDEHNGGGSFVAVDNHSSSHDAAGGPSSSQPQGKVGEDASESKDSSGKKKNVSRRAGHRGSYDEQNDKSTAKNEPQTHSSSRQRPKLRRQHSHIDFQTGCPTERTQKVKPCPDKDSEACSPRKKVFRNVSEALTSFAPKMMRRKNRDKKANQQYGDKVIMSSCVLKEKCHDSHGLSSCEFKHNDVEAHKGQDDDCGSDGEVYRIHSKDGGQNDAGLKRLWGFPRDPSNFSFATTAAYFRWSFSAPLWQVAGVTLANYFLLIILFASFVWAKVHFDPLCVAVDQSAETRLIYMDAVQLSWTTLTTVGFGIIAPRLHVLEQDVQCLGLKATLALEAFVGLMFANMTAAIIFNKVGRIQSVAQVLFSDPICVRYGTGVMQERVEDGGNTDNAQQAAGLNQGFSGLGDTPRRMPCPILEFRVVNRLSAVKGGEIINASLNVVATTLANTDKAEIKTELSQIATQDSEGLLENAADALDGAATLATKGVGMAAKGAGKAAHVATKSVAGATNMVAQGLGVATSSSGECIDDQAHTEAPSDEMCDDSGGDFLLGTQWANDAGASLMGAGTNATQATGSIIQRINHALSRPHGMDIPGSDQSDINPFKKEQDNGDDVKADLKEEQSVLAGATPSNGGPSTVTVDEGNEQLSPSRIFHKLSIETDTHPFFKRIWTIRHRLDKSSPLLDRATRLRIEQNDGYWPDELNNYEQVCKHLRFYEIICNLSGTSNASGSSVFAHTVYYFSDVNIGYSFANALGFNKGGALFADVSLLNDVNEQRGGGAEPMDEDTGDR